MHPTRPDTGLPEQDRPAANRPVTPPVRQPEVGLPASVSWLPGGTEGNCAGESGPASYAPRIAAGQDVFSRRQKGLGTLGLRAGSVFLGASTRAW